MPPDENTRRGQELPGLDGLRALAVCAVLLFHRFLLPVGWVGVQIFFVLSGYLITRLLKRDKAQRLGRYLRHFYGRRALRIFPLYYLTIAILAIVTFRAPQLKAVQDALPYAASYTYNFWYATHERDFSLLITHFWSLCVEEQFYLFWPFLIYFCPERRLKPVLLSILALGPLLRLFGVWYFSRPGATQLFDPGLALDVSTPAQIDAFATGALVTMFPRKVTPRILASATCALALAGAWIILRFHVPLLSFGYPIGMSQGYSAIWGYSAINIWSGLLIACLVQGTFLPGLFNARPLTYLGRISYALYVIHYPMQAVSDKLLPEAQLSARVALQLVLTVALASLSFFLWEAPFLSMKERWFRTPATAEARV